MTKADSRKIKLTQKQRGCLEHIARRQTNPYFLVMRAKIILAIETGASQSQLARQLLVERSTVVYWLDRWNQEASRISGAQEAGASDSSIAALIEEALNDKPRSGAPSTFSAEQVCQIIAVACEKPSECERPISHWTERELAEEVMKRKIVDTISVRSVGRFLKSG